MTKNSNYTGIQILNEVLYFSRQSTKSMTNVKRSIRGTPKSINIGTNNGDKYVLSE